MPFSAFTIDTALTSRRQRQCIRAIGGASALLAFLAMTLGRAPGSAIPVVFPALAGAIVITEILAAAVLVQQFFQSRLPALALRAAAYVTSAFLIVPYLLTFPGMFSPERHLWGSNNQSSVALWSIWHLAFPAFILAGLIVEERRVGRLSRGGTWLFASAVLVLSCAIAIDATLVVTRYSSRLPVLIVGTRFTVLKTCVILPLIATLDLAVLAVTVRYKSARRAVNLWLGLAVFCSLLDAMMGVLCDRYSAGWYVGKSFSLLTSTVVVAAFLFEGAKSQRHLALKNHELRSTSERERAAAQRLSYLASHDALTNLPNRALLLQRLREAIDSAERLGERMAVVFLDLDRFKVYNDTLGHAAGDRILREVAKRTISAVREGDTVARNGGDEFIVILTKIGDARRARLAGERILAALDAPLRVEGHEIPIGASLGISLYPEDSTTVEGLIRAADAAMYRAKGSGRGQIALFEPAVTSGVRAI